MHRNGRRWKQSEYKQKTHYSDITWTSYLLHQGWGIGLDWRIEVGPLFINTYQLREWCSCMISIDVQNRRQLSHSFYWNYIFCSAEYRFSGDRSRQGDKIVSFLMRQIIYMRFCSMYCLWCIFFVFHAVFKAGGVLLKFRVLTASLPALFFPATACLSFIVKKCLGHWDEVLYGVSFKRQYHTTDRIFLSGNRCRRITMRFNDTDYFIVQASLCDAFLMFDQTRI